MVLSGLDERGRIFRKARAAEARPRMQELRADPVIEANPTGHILNVGPYPLGQIRHLVDEGDLGREEGIGRVFDELGRAAAGVENGPSVEIEWPIDLGHHLACPFIIGADHDAIGMLEVLNGGTLAEEFRIGHDGDVGIRPHFMDDARDLVAGAHRHRRFGDDHRETINRLGDLARGRVDVGEIGMTVPAPGRRADRNENCIGRSNGLCQLQREDEAPGPRVARDELIEPGLEDRRFANAQERDFFRVLVDANDLVAEIGKTGARDKPHIAGADHCDLHENPLDGWRAISRVTPSRVAPLYRSLSLTPPLSPSKTERGVRPSLPQGLMTGIHSP